MISKFLSKLKSILFKSPVSPETPLKKEKKAAKSAKTKTKTKTKTKLSNSKKNIETLTTLPGVGVKSAKALYEAGFKTIPFLIFSIICFDKVVFPLPEGPLINISFIFMLSY